RRADHQLSIESSPDASRVHEPAVHHVRELERAEVRTRTLRLRETDNDEVGGGLGFDLEPDVPAPFAVRGVGSFGDDTLEAERDHLLHEGIALALDVIEGADDTDRGESFQQERLARRQRQWAKIDPIERQEVEGEE